MLAKLERKGMGEGVMLLKDQYKKVIPAPEWYKKQLEELRKLPPPTMEEVQKTFDASMEARKKSIRLLDI